MPPEVPIADAWLVRASRGDAIENLGAAGDLGIASAAGVSVAVGGTIFDVDVLANRFGFRNCASAAEVILAAYQAGGVEALTGVRGHFAIVLSDGPRHRVVALRDPMGLHPLFYARVGVSLLFSWSTDALTSHPGVSREPSRVMLCEHLLHRWSDPTETYLSDISRLPGGHRLEWNGTGTVATRRYWDPAANGIQWLDESQIGSFEEALDRAVARSLDGGPAAIWLSGGFDSISVAAVAVDLARRSGGPVPRALSLGFPDPGCNEEPVQRGVARSLGVDQDFVGFADAVGDRGLLLPAAEMAATWPMPMTNIWNPAYYQLAKRGYQQGARIILTGNGGDEWLTVSPYLSADLIRAGRFADAARFIGVVQRSYRISSAEAVFGGVWKFGLRPLVTMAVGRAFPKAFQSRRMRRMAESVPEWVAPDPELRRAVQDRADRVLAPPEPKASYYEREMRTALDHPLNSIEAEEYFEMGRRLGMKIRHPYWDSDLVDVLYRVPPHILFKGGRAKGLVRETIARRFPNLGFERQRKVHATDFYWRTMQTEGPASWRSLGGASALGALGVVDAKLHATAMTQLFAGERPRESYRIWNTLQLEAWTRARV